MRGGKRAERGKERSQRENRGQTTVFCHFFAENRRKIGGTPFFLLSNVIVYI